MLVGTFDCGEVAQGLDGGEKILSWLAESINRFEVNFLQAGVGEIQRWGLPFCHFLFIDRLQVIESHVPGPRDPQQVKDGLVLISNFLMLPEICRDRWQRKIETHPNLIATLS
jgi:hypothetical protein